MHVDEESTRFAIASPTEILDRFAIRFEPSIDDLTVSMSMPVAGHINPVNGHPTVAALTLLIDTVGGLANHARCHSGESTVTSELAMDLVPEAAALASHPDAPPVIATGRAYGERAATSLAACALVCGGRNLGVATVRSYFVVADPDPTPPPETLGRSSKGILGQLLSLVPEQRTSPAAPPALVQRHDPVLVNSLGIVNGGISSACLALAAGAAVDARAEAPMQMGSFRANFLRPLEKDTDIRYVADVQRLGKQTALATARVSAGGDRPPLSGMFTAYR
ncbi:hypothetical protein BA059_20720 [Mycolicibacterium sp. (ex Dasyatis americana)]|nr:hypothetical protein BA059_20720 [Mycolicibacterium sp. (ex Dasyatis americana)]